MNNLFNIISTINIPYSSFDKFFINHCNNTIYYIKNLLIHKSVLGISNFQLFFWSTFIFLLLIIDKFIAMKLNDNKINISSNNTNNRSFKRW